MVYFEDEMKALEEKERQNRPRWRKNLGIALRIALYLTVFVFIALTVLSRVGGSGDHLRSGVEQALGETTGTHAKIGKLDYLSFFPTVRIEFSDALFRKKEDENPVALAAHFKFATGFWDLFTMNRRVNVFELSDLTVQEDAGFSRSFDIKTASLKKPSGGQKPALIVEGQYGDAPVLMRVDVDYVDTGNGRPYFAFTNGHDFDIKLGDVTLQGRYVFLPEGGLRLDFSSVGAAAAKVGDGTMTLLTMPKRGVSVKGAFKIGQSSKIALDLMFGKTANGQIAFSEVTKPDVDGNQGLLSFIRALHGFAMGESVKTFSLPQGVAMSVNGTPVKVETLDGVIEALALHTK